MFVVLRAKALNTWPEGSEAVPVTRCSSAANSKQFLRVPLPCRVIPKTNEDDTQFMSKYVTTSYTANNHLYNFMELELLDIFSKFVALDILFFFTNVRKMYLFIEFKSLVIRTLNSFCHNNSIMIINHITTKIILITIVFLFIYISFYYIIYIFFFIIILKHWYVNM